MLGTFFLFYIQGVRKPIQCNKKFNNIGTFPIVYIVYVMYIQGEKFKMTIYKFLYKFL